MDDPPLPIRTYYFTWQNPIIYASWPDNSPPALPPLIIQRNLEVCCIAIAITQCIQARLNIIAVQRSDPPPPQLSVRYLIEVITRLQVSRRDPTIRGLLQWIECNGLLTEDNYLAMRADLPMVHPIVRIQIPGWEGFDPEGDDFGWLVVEEMQRRGPLIGEFGMRLDYDFDGRELYMAAGAVAWRHGRLGGGHAVLLTGWGIEERPIPPPPPPPPSTLLRRSARLQSIHDRDHRDQDEIPGDWFFEYRDSQGLDFGENGFGVVSVGALHFVYAPNVIYPEQWTI